MGADYCADEAAGHVGTEQRAVLVPGQPLPALACIEAEGIVAAIARDLELQ
jgi:hypothetical protein